MEAEWKAQIADVPLNRQLAKPALNNFFFPDGLKPRIKHPERKLGANTAQVLQTENGAETELQGGIEPEKDGSAPVATCSFLVKILSAAIWEGYLFGNFFEN